MSEDEIDLRNEYEDECWNCGGEGYVYDCFEEWACIDPEGGCDLCMRRCDVCRPRKPNPELQAVLAEALASVDRSPEGQDAQRLDAEHESAVPKADAQPEGPLP